MFGWPLVAAIAIFLLLGKPWCWLALVPGVFLLWLVSFFRDPKRVIPDGPNLLVAPADGLVTDVTQLPHYDFLGAPAVRVGIFLSIFNVHIKKLTTSQASFSTHSGPNRVTRTNSCGSASRRWKRPRAGSPYGRFQACWPGESCVICSPDRRSREAKSLV
jgi:hypothetical protein